MVPSQLVVLEAVGRRIETAVGSVVFVIVAARAAGALQIRVRVAAVAARLVERTVIAFRLIW